MNAQRRKELKSVVKKMDQINDVIDLIIVEIESIQSDEEFAYDNLPESFQDGMRGEDMQEAIDTMEESVEALEELKGIITEKVEGIKSDLIVL